MDGSVFGLQDAAIAFVGLVVVTLKDALIVGSEPLDGVLVLAAGVPIEDDVSGKDAVNP